MKRAGVWWVLIWVGCGGDDRPSCPTDDRPYTQDLLPGVTGFIEPLGLLSPPSHTLPTDHAYLDVGDTAAQIVAPGDVTVLRVQQTRYVVSASRQGRTDVTIELSPCAERRLKLAHVQALDPAFVAAVGDPSTSDDCSMRSTSDETIEECSLQPEVQIAAGSPIGTAGGVGATSRFLDLGAIDDRISLAFANPARAPWLTHVACPFDGWVDALRASYEARLPATASPRCGRVDFDVPGTAAGMWVRADYQPSDGFLEGFALALARGHVDASVQRISLGEVGTLGGAGAWDVGAPAASGTVGRDFEAVVPGAVYCYEGLVASGQPAVALVELPDPASLRLEVVPAASCAAAPTTLSSAAVAFVR